MVSVWSLELHRTTARKDPPAGMFWRRLSDALVGADSGIPVLRAQRPRSFWLPLPSALHSGPVSLRPLRACIVLAFAGPFALAAGVGVLGLLTVASSFGRAAFGVVALALGFGIGCLCGASGKRGGMTRLPLRAGSPRQCGRGLFQLSLLAPVGPRSQPEAG